MPIYFVSFPIGRNQGVAHEKYQLLSIVDETNPVIPYQMVLVYASSSCFNSMISYNLLEPKLSSEYVVSAWALSCLV